MHIIRIGSHPKDPDVALLRVPYDCNELMGRYEPAQFDRELGGYLLHVDQLDSFDRFASYTGLYVIDERGLTEEQARRGDLCWICMKPQYVCQRSAGNRGTLQDHLYRPASDAEREYNARKKIERSLRDVVQNG